MIDINSIQCGIKEKGGSTPVRSAGLSQFFSGDLRGKRAGGVKICIEEIFEGLENSLVVNGCK